MTERAIEKGDRGAWDHSQGNSKRRVVDVATEPGQIEDFHYAASEDDPKYVVESEESGAHAAHAADELRKS